MLPEANAIIGQGYRTVTKPARHEAADTRQMPIIPLLGSAAAEVEAPEWPSIGEADVGILLRRAGGRIEAVAGRLLAQQTLSAFFKLALPFTWILPLLTRRRIERTIMSDLVRRDLVREWRIPDDWGPPDPAPFLATGEPPGAAPLNYRMAVRAVIAQLLAPGFDLRTDAGIAASSHLDPCIVGDIVDRCAAANGARFQVWVSGWRTADGSRVVSLMSDRPSYLRRKLGLKPFGLDFLALRMDSSGAAAGPVPATTSHPPTSLETS